MEYFADKGINVRFYPEKTFEAFKQRVYEDEIKKFIGYYKDHVEGYGAAVIFIRQMKSL